MTFRRLLVATALLATSSVFAADSAPEPSTADVLAPARAQIAAGHWAAAIDELKKVNATSSADWNNLMGYSLRRRKQPDLEGAEHFYDEALRLEPKHRGALEYSGVLYLVKGDLPRAEQRLAALDKVCTFSCEEYRDLKKAVAAYKANGNRYVQD
jgi:Flp pilus assembly protein TadD